MPVDLRLSIITINRNNAIGLEKTLKSVISQTNEDFELIVIDGASTDESVEIIRYNAEQSGERIKWISEPDKGIYDAMNKGIRMATGEYVEFLNSGDCLASADVVSKMYAALEENGNPSILYGNMLKDMPDGTVLKDKCFAGKDISFLGFYTGTLNHSPAFIRRDLFDKYGLYDESLKIVYVDLDVTLFDMNGISETNKELDKAERKKVLEELVPNAVLMDYDKLAFSIDQMKRLKRHPWAYKMVWFLERCLFKLEKGRRKRSREVEYL